MCRIDPLATFTTILSIDLAALLFIAAELLSISPQLRFGRRGTKRVARAAASHWWLRPTNWKLERRHICSGRRARAPLATAAVIGAEITAALPIVRTCLVRSSHAASMAVRRANQKLLATAWHFVRAESPLPYATRLCCHRARDQAETAHCEYHQYRQVPQNT